MPAETEWEPPADFLEKCGARLNAMFQKEFEQRLAEKKDNLPVRNAVHNIQRKLTKDDKNVEALVKDLTEKSRRKGKSPLEDSAQLKPLTTYVPTFHYNWTWNTKTNDGEVRAAVDPTTGNMSFSIFSGQDSGTASSRVMLGTYIRPAVGKTWIQVFANPSYTQNNWAHQWLSDSSTHGRMGIKIEEFNAANAAPVRTVVDKISSLWNTEDGDFSAANSAYPLNVMAPVTSTNFYVVWVWAGGDCDGDGWSTFWGSSAGAWARITVPSMTINTY